MQAFAWNSRLARRLVKIFVLLVAVPLIVTVLMLGRVGREQIVWTARTMAHINETAVSDAGHEFRQIGRDALHQSSAQTEAISIHGLQSVSQMMAKIQKDSLSATARDFSALTNSSLDGAMRQSLATNRSTLSGVNNEMARLFARSANDTQQRAAGRVEVAMLEIIGSLMQEQASRLADSVEEHVDDATTDLTITAQMPDLRNGNAPGQKAILDALVRRYPEFNVVAVLDSSGNETAMSAPDRVVTKSDLGQHTDSPYFQTAMHGQTYVGVENEPAHGAPVLRVAVPVEVYRGKPVGALAARVSLVDLWDQIRGVRIGKQGFAYVLDGKNHPLLPARRGAGGLLERSGIVKTLQWRVVVAQPREEAMQPITALKKDIAENTRRALVEMRGNIQKSSSVTAARLQQDEVRLRTETSAQVQRRSNEVLQHLLTKTNRQTQAQLIRMQQALQTQTQKTQQDNNRQLIAAANAASESLSARVQPLTSQALTRADRRLSLLALVITIVSCLLSCLLALIVAGRIVRPVVRLVQGTQAIAQGDLEKRVDERAPDEIGDLAVAFNTMADSLLRSRAELHEAEAQLVQSAKLASLGTLSAGVAHELNQPVAIIRGIAQQLASEEGLTEDMKADLDLIEGQTSRMMKIIKHLRTFCRTGGAEVHEVDVNQVVQDCFILIGAQLKAHDVEVELDLCGDSSPVLGDANELEQVCLNLITNARDALEGRPDARITIRTRMEDDRLVLEFRDNGPGIPDDDLAQIFDPFFTTKDPGKGTGLGLSISDSIIRKHHGKIRVENDQGAVFTIVLPLALSYETDAERPDLPKVA